MDDRFNIKLLYIGIGERIAPIAELTNPDIDMCHVKLETHIILNSNKGKNKISNLRQN